jgi:hypothetical protein
MKTVQTTPGQILRIKKATVAIDGGVADLNSPHRRHLIVLLLGVSDPGVPFDVETMLAALGYVPGPQLQALIAQEEKGDAG